jgi:hypothetical protein
VGFGKGENTGSTNFIGRKARMMDMPVAEASA